LIKNPSLATGTCRVRVVFPSPSGGGGNSGFYKIRVNGTDIIDFTDYTNTSGTLTHDINLRAANNPGTSTIELFAYSMASGYYMLNTTFELLCAENPGLLGLLG